MKRCGKEWSVAEINRCVAAATQKRFRRTLIDTGDIGAGGSGVGGSGAVGGRDVGGRGVGGSGVGDSGVGERTGQVTC